ncbi:hypothetical protein QM996_27605 (plasmid) [Sinorhizobium chiapasense]|uniref:hypothetical protein n=1 Tax=Sinorhizobium chiapasense TaxID=501572 RepID=UPI002FE4255A
MPSYQQHNYGASERKFTTGLSIVVLLISMSVIAAYLLIGGALSNDTDHPATIVLPKPAVANSR